MIIACSWCDKDFEWHTNQCGWACCSQSCAYTISGSNYHLSAYAQRVAIRQQEMVDGKSWWRGGLSDEARAAIIIPEIIDDLDEETPWLVA